MVAVLGSYEPQGAVTFQSSKGTSAGITKGELCNISAGKWVKTPAAAAVAGPFAVCTKTATAAATTVQLVKKGIVHLTADGTITVNALVQPATATAGQVIAYTASSVTSTVPTGTETTAAAADFSRVVGIYLGHEGEGDGNTIPTNAADGDVIRVLMTGAV